MIPWMESVSLLVLLAGLWFWLDSFKSRAAGLRAARAACVADGLLLLDDTVALATLRWQRNEEGRLRLRRVYHFEYSDTGDNRRHGYVTLLGDEVLLLHLSEAQECRRRTLAIAGAAGEEPSPPPP